MPKLTLYKVGANGRLALGDLVAADDFYTAELGHDDEGADTIVLTRVEVATTGTKRTVAGDQEPIPFA